MSTDEKNHLSEKLGRSFFALGDLYVERKKSSRLKLLRAGDFLDNERLKKIEKISPEQIQYLEMIHADFVSEGVALWDALKNAASESERFLVREKLLYWFKEAYWDGKKEASLLDLVWVIEKTFNRFDRSVVGESWDVSTLICSRSIFLSSALVPFALFSGYMDFHYLSDLYHATFLMDSGFDKNHFSFLLAQALEAERKSDAVVLTSEDRDLFHSHVEKSHEWALKHYSEYFNDLGVLDLLLKHHEKTTGEGWPHHLHEGDTSEIENILISLNQILPYEERFYTKNDGAAFFKELVSSGGDLKARRFERLCRSLFDMSQSIPLAEGA